MQKYSIPFLFLTLLATSAMLFGIVSAAPVSMPAITNGIIPQTVTLSPSANVFDSGQNVTFNVTVYNGVGPFNVQLFNITGLKPVANVIITHAAGSKQDSNTITFQ